MLHRTLRYYGAHDTVVWQSPIFEVKQLSFILALDFDMISSI